MSRSGLGPGGAMALVLAGCLASFACGDDSGGDDGDTGGDTVVPGDTGATGDGMPDVAGDGDMTTTAGDGDTGMMMAADVQCGSAVCPNLAAAIPFPGLDNLFPAPCCVDEATSTCGMLNGGVCEEPPPNHPVCPPLVTGFGIDGTSCCIEESNECGIIAPPPLGMGECTSLVEASSGTGGGIGGFITFPDPVDCQGNPIEVPTDADAGL